MCTHHWMIDQYSAAVCQRCGDERQFDPWATAVSSHYHGDPEKRALAASRKSEYRGVRWSPYGWDAIRTTGRSTHTVAHVIGTYRTQEAAALAYNAFCDALPRCKSVRNVVKEVV